MKHTLALFLLLFSAAVIFPQKITSNRKPAVKKPAVAKLPVSDGTEFKNAAALTDFSEKIAALTKFIADFPESRHKPEAQEMLAIARVSFADERLQSGDLDTAASLYKSAVDEAPPPVSDKLFSESFAKIPAALFWKGKRNEALNIAKNLNVMADGSVGRLLALTDFYLGIESGADARALAEKAVGLDPTSSKAYLTLGTADRLDFRIEDSAASYAKALELDAASDTARRGLADMKRALGKPDEAAALYRDILTKDAANIPAQTGLVLSLFDDGKTADAEGEMAKSLEQNPNNMILLAGAAYWYAAHGNGDKAVELAGKAVETEPRYIWSHIALARGYLAKKQPAEAERVLVKARQYGNFPTLEYELASARRMSGFYREAAEELRKSFSVRDGMIVTNLGGRVSTENKSFIDLLSAERRASIFEPNAADDAENAAELKALLEFDQTLNSGTAGEDEIAKAADAFAGGGDTTRLYRRLYAASALLEKRVALAKVIDLTKDAVGTTDSGFDVPDPGAAVMASELYDSRSIAFARGEYIIVPVVPRQTLSAILRGRIEELAGWALYYQNQPAEAVVRLKRAVSVLPNPSAWWRSSMWRLGAALQADAKDTEALDAYIKSYKTDKPDAVKYSIVEALYKKVNGSSDGLEKKIGQNPAQPETTAEKTDATAEIKPVPTPEKIVPENKPVRTPRNVPIKAEPPPQPEIAAAQPTVTPQPETVAAKTTDTVVSAQAASSPEVTPQSEAVAVKTTDLTAPPQAAPSPEITPQATPDAGIVKQISPEKIVDLSPAVTDTGKEPEKTAGLAQVPASDTQTAVEKPSEKVAEPSPQPVTEQTPANETKQDNPAGMTAAPTVETIAKGTPTEKITEPVPQPAETPAPTAEKVVQPAEKLVEPPIVDTAKTDQKEQPATDSTQPKTKAQDVPELKSTPPIETKKTEATETAKSSKPIFDPIIINVPKASSSEKPVPVGKPEILKSDDVITAQDKPKPGTTPAKPPGGSGEIRPRVVADKSLTEITPKCLINVSRESLSIINGAGSVGILISVEGEGNIRAVTSASSSPKDLEVVLEPEIAGAEDKAFYLINSISSKKGIYQVSFELPCGRKEILVTVY